MARARTQPDEPESDEPVEVEGKTSEPAETSVAADATEGSLPSVIQALSRVMGDVQSISKDSRNTSQNFNFRGIDAVMNAVGPALRQHGVVVVPIKTEFESENYTTSRGTAMKGVMLTVTFRFYGPAGDYIDACATGEASDSGDKAMPKAHSVAFRTLLLQALCIPTDEPDPDTDSHQRAAAQPSQGSSGTEPQARQRGSRTEGRPVYNYPKDWKELAERMAELLGQEEAVVWISQAVEMDTGERTSISKLPEDAKRLVWGTLTKVLRSLDEELKVDPRAFPPPTRDEIAAEFAKHLEGGPLLAGPQWALNPEEADAGMPSKEAWLNAAAAGDAAPDDAASAPEGPENEEPDEEISEQQRLLDEEAAAAAEYDREQFRDRA